MIKPNFFPFPSYRRALCSVCFASYINLLLFFPFDLPLGHLLPDYPTVCLQTAPCFQFSLCPNYSCLDFFFYLRPVVAAAQICCTT